MSYTCVQKMSYLKIQSLLKHILLNYIGQLTIGANMQANCKTLPKRCQTDIRRNFLEAQLSLLWRLQLSHCSLPFFFAVSFRSLESVLGDCPVAYSQTFRIAFSSLAATSLMLTLTWPKLQEAPAGPIGRRKVASSRPHRADVLTLQSRTLTLT